MAHTKPSDASLQVAVPIEETSKLFDGYTFNPSKENKSLVISKDLSRTLSVPAVSLSELNV